MFVVFLMIIFVDSKNVKKNLNFMFALFALLFTHYYKIWKIKKIVSQKYSISTKLYIF